MTADQTGSFIIIRVCDLVLFEPGQATVLDAFKPVAARVAATLDKEPGHIKIVGHTDNFAASVPCVSLPISNSRSSAQRPSRPCSSKASPIQAESMSKERGLTCRSPATRRQRGEPRTGASKSLSNEVNSREWMKGQHASKENHPDSILYGVGLGSLAAVIYFAGPFIAIGNWHPLENSIVRNIVILLLVAGAAAVAWLQFLTAS